MAMTLRGSLPLLLFVVGIVAGIAALVFTPREEEPQIVVPMIDVLVEAPGLSSKQTERQVTIPLEKLLAQIPGVEHVYSATDAGSASVTLRFHVGEDREDSLLNTYNKLYANQDQIPAVVSRWLLKPVEVDDVPILVLALWSEDEERYSDFELRRIADEFSTALQAIPQTSEVKVVGGRPRTLRILLEPESLAARRTTATDIIAALQVSNVLDRTGTWTLDDEAFELEAGDVLREPSQLQSLVVNVIDGAPVYLRDVAQIVDGPAEPESYQWIDFADAVAGEGQGGRQYPMVAISIAKQRGANAVTVSRDALSLMAELERVLLPPEINVSLLRDYGRTANEKVNNLSSSLGFRDRYRGGIHRPVPWLAAGTCCRPRGTGVLRHHPGAGHAPWLHHQSRHPVCTDSVPRPAGRRPDYRRGQHRPLYRPAGQQPRRAGGGGDARDPGSAADVDDHHRRRVFCRWRSSPA
jgi:multidrug efflux pump subunit AcrB